MKINRHSETGSVILCAIAIIVIISLVAAGVLMNTTARYNATSKQVKAWKEALYAAEAGGDFGYVECRKASSAPGTQFTGGTWAVVSGAATPTWTLTTPATFGTNNSLSASVIVDQVFTDTNSNPFYRIRSVGNATVYGLKRVGMDDRMNATTRGDSLLRKIDFNYDHFIAAYGDGDGNNKQLLTVTTPKISRRIELIAAPVEPFEGFLKCLASFSGPGSAGVCDSYDSHNGAYYFCANNPADPHYLDSRNGSVSVNTPTFSQGGTIYGDVSTNGGNVTHSNSSITGTIDNNVSFTAPPVVQPVPPASNPYKPGSPATINPSSTATNSGTPDWYLYSVLDGVTINARTDASGNPIETYVTVVVTGNVGKITINKGVNARIYFAGSLSAKARDIVNNNVDGATGVKNADGTPSTNVSRAGHFQFMGITPTDGSTQVIDIAPPGNVWATFYAPSATFQLHGNPDIYGAITCNNFTGNGNTGFHFDKALRGTAGPPIDYRIASYVEDVR
ncbi:MAG TPA: hypothetical protein VH170_08215 [Chthoniobacterales bacterium]|jgi:hypothetical protein|nr:hypothetical protein [Chthoniobacterales bacterium]